MKGTGFLSLVLSMYATTLSTEVLPSANSKIRSAELYASILVLLPGTRYCLKDNGSKVKIIKLEKSKQLTVEINDYFYLREIKIEGEILL